MSVTPGYKGCLCSSPHGSRRGHVSANIAMPRSLDTWPTVAAPRAEDAGSNGGQAIVLLGAGPFQDL